MRKMTIDKIDVEILNIISNAPSLPNNEIARRIKLSPSSTLERIKNLKKTGIIRRQLSLINYDLLGYANSVIIRMEIPKSLQPKLYYELQQRHIVAVWSYYSNYNQTLQVDAIGYFRTLRSIEKLCDTLVNRTPDVKIIGVFNIYKLEKITPMNLQQNDTLK